jgi:heterodisulfide reductase subunit A
MEPETLEVEVGAIVVATGYELYADEAVQAYGYGSHPDVLNGLEFERLLSASGPTGGQVTRPSDGKTPKEIVFIQCAGSRNPEHGMPYCSKICCMYTAKHAILYKHRVHDGQVYVFYMDVRAGGKGYEEFVNRAMEEERTVYIRGRVAKVFPQNGKIMVWGADTLTDQKIEVAADMVVVAAAIVPWEKSRQVAEMLGIDVDESGFYTPSNEEMTPVESGVLGVFIAGVGLGPQDIPETVAQASGASAKVLILFGAAKAKEAIASVK